MKDQLLRIRGQAATGMVGTRSEPLCPVSPSNGSLVSHAEIQLRVLASYTPRHQATRKGDAIGHWTIVPPGIGQEMGALKEGLARSPNSCLYGYQTGREEGRTLL